MCVCVCVCVCVCCNPSQDSVRVGSNKIQVDFKVRERGVGETDWESREEGKGEVR